MRDFSPVPRSEDDSDEHEILAILAYQAFKSWLEIDKEYRSIILAEAGAGKTFEMLARANYLAAQGHAAFFIRIEGIVGEFEQAFEVGCAETFEQWLGSQSEAWFYLDSVDEARLVNPRAFEKAIRYFAARIKNAQLRAHICISSRPYAWRPRSDRELIEQHLPFEKPQAEPTGENSKQSDTAERSESALEIYLLRPLDEDDIRFFAMHRSAPEVDSLIDELERSNLMALAGRPFDLEGILAKWTSDQTLGGRSELLRHNIDLRLKEIDPDRARRQPLNLDMAGEGARMLAAAVILTGEPGIQVPDKTHEHMGIDAEAVLADWDPGDVQALLERAIFDDVLYGAVRFRHREVRELLAAEWFAELLQKGNARHAIEALIFREQYGEQIISPRLRPILPWLILDEEKIRNRTLATHPEIAVEGGDPARLPLPERKKILIDIVERIAQDEDTGAARDNSAIARIAQPDLTDETLTLLDQHADNEDAIFFLGRLVWQGEMSGCVPPLLTIAADPARGIYTRIAAARAVITCGTIEQKATLWNSLLAAAPEFPRELLAELVQDVPADAMSVAILLDSIDKLPPYDRFKTTGLTQALHGFIDRLPPAMNADADQPLAMLVGGLDTILDRPPYIEQHECRVSGDFAWLLRPATHAVERLVSSRAEAAMQNHAIAIMLKSLAARDWCDQDFDDYKNTLGELVPAWPELNDALFWQSIDAARTQREGKGKRLNNDWPVQWLNYYWSFGPDSFPRVLKWVKALELEDDRLVALSLAYRIYGEAGKPVRWVDQLRDAVTRDAVLVSWLDERLNPTISEEDREWQRKNVARNQKYELERREQEQYKSDWIARLKANPDLVRNPPGLEPGELSNYQYCLLREVEDSGLRTNRSQGADWQSLIDEFGNDVALAFRDAAIAHWRHFKPELRSEGADTSSFPPSLPFAIAGLEIEAREVDEFPAHLGESEMRHALRYTTWELNGFPSWLEAMHRAHPHAVMEAIQTELSWELANTKTDQPMHYILHDLTYHAPWLHGALVEPLLTWVRENDLPSRDVPRYCLHILRSGGVDPAELGIVAQAKVEAERSSEHLPYWYAIWVDAEPDTGIVGVANWLAELGPDRSSHSAQLFITALMGSRHGDDSGPNIGNFRTARHLKSLYVLMHDHIRAKEDINRAGGGVYSPELRDDAQDARDRLFNLLSEIPGKEAHVALTELVKEHPAPDRRPWMAKRAHKRAEQDGDLEPWTAGQVSEFGSALTRTPSTHRQLFDLTLDRLTDLKDWLERGNDSPYRTWQRAGSENEMRILVAGWLNAHWGNLYTTAQEPELANSQRIDIWLQTQNVGSPVPIELKLLDKRWSGPQLCERLRNQLVGDYLREGTERCGLMLLVWGGSKAERRWRIGGRRVGVSGLREALKDYWASISNSFPNIATLEVVVIDLTLRAIRSDH